MFGATSLGAERQIRNGKTPFWTMTTFIDSIFPLIWQKIRVVLHVWTRRLDQTCRYREYKTDKIFTPSPIELSLKLFN